MGMNKGKNMGKVITQLVQQREKFQKDAQELQAKHNIQPTGQRKLRKGPQPIRGFQITISAVGAAAANQSRLLLRMNCCAAPMPFRYHWHLRKGLLNQAGAHRALRCRAMRCSASGHGTRAPG